ncbi:MAG: hypothetical protein KGL16_12115, partial [Acidobacteriota bacterium]|nr:hypothetical protein [Acidobacteriota bacterium]
MLAGLPLAALEFAALICLALVLEGAPQRLYAEASGVKAGLSWRVLSGLGMFAAGAGALVLSASAPSFTALAAATAA